MRVSVLMEQAVAPVPGGTGRYTLELAAALARTAAAGDSVTGWTALHRDVMPAVSSGVAGPRRLPIGRRMLAVLWQSGLGPAPHGADVVHAPTLLFPPRRQPLVVTIHDAVPWTHPETLTRRGASWHRSMAARAARVADAVAVPSHSVADELSEILPALKGRLTVLGAGVSRALRDEPAPELAARAAARLELPERFVLSLATLEPRKGLDVLVAALADMSDSAPNLLVAGQPGWGGLDVSAAARRAGLPEEQVRVLGRISDLELAVVLRRAQMLVAPSRAEGFGLPVAEAMAVGTPVVCSDAPALVEIVGDAAVVVPRGDVKRLAEAIEHVLSDGPQRRRLAAAGLARSTRYDWDDVARRAWGLYRAVANADTASA